MGFFDDNGSSSGSDDQRDELLQRLTITQRSRLGTLFEIEQSAQDSATRDAARREQQRVLSQVTGDVTRGTVQSDGSRLETFASGLERIFAPIIAPVSSVNAIIGETLDVTGIGAGNVDGSFDIGTIARASNFTPFGPREFVGFGENAQRLTGDAGNEALFRVPGLDFDVTVNRLLGFTGDVLLDPLTYVGGVGLIGDATRATSQAARAGSRAGQLTRFNSRNDLVRQVLANRPNAPIEDVGRVAAAIQTRRLQSIDPEELLSFGIDSRLTFGIGSKRIVAIPGTNSNVFRNLRAPFVQRNGRGLGQLISETTIRGTDIQLNQARIFGSPSNRIRFDAAVEALNEGSPEAFTSFAARYAADVERVTARNAGDALAKRLRRQVADSVTSEGQRRKSIKGTRDLLVANGEQVIDAIEAGARSIDLDGETLNIGGIADVLSDVARQLQLSGLNINAIQNYFPRFRSDLQIARAVTGSNTVDASILQARNYRPGGTFLGEVLETGDIEELRRIAKRLGGTFDLFDTNPIAVLDQYIQTASRLISTQEALSRIAAQGFGVSTVGFSKVFSHALPAATAREILQSFPEKLRDAVAIWGSSDIRRVRDNPEQWGQHLDRQLAIRSASDIDPDDLVRYENAAGFFNLWEATVPIVSDQTRGVLEQLRRIEEGVLEPRRAEINQRLIDIENADPLDQLGLARERAALNQELQDLSDLVAQQPQLTDALRQSQQQDLARNLAEGRDEVLADYNLIRSHESYSQGLLRTELGIRSNADDDFAKFAQRLIGGKGSEGARLRTMLNQSAAEVLRAPYLTQSDVVEGLAGLARWDMGTFSKTVTAYNRLFKSMAVATPGFSVRNLYSGFIGAEIAAGHGISEARWFRRNLRQYRRDPSKMSDDDRRIFQLLEANGDVDGITPDGNIRNRTEALFGRSPFADSSTRIGDVDVLDNLAGTAAGRGVSAVSSSFARVGRVLDERIGGLIVGPGGGGATMPVETFLRGSHIAARMRRGNSYNSARESALDFHFSYRDLSIADQKARALIPFWTFISRNTPLQAQLLFRRPGLFNNLIRWQAAIEEREADVLQPEYYNSFLSYPIPGQDTTDGSGQLNFVPDLLINDVIERIYEVKQEGVKFPIKFLLTNSSPILKAPIEIAMNQSAFTGNQISPDYRPNGPLIGAEVGGVGTNAALGRLIKLPVLEETFDFFVRQLGPEWLGVNEETNTVYVNEQVNYGLAQTLPILAQLRRLFPPDDDFYEERVLSSWLSYVGVATRTIDQRARNAEAFNRLERERRVLAALENAGALYPGN